MFDLLAEFGPLLRMPHSRHLGGGLRELRFHCEGVDRRVTHFLDPDRLAVVLTTIRSSARTNGAKSCAPTRS
ncbi:type II toxin-antitoxin system RelE/ParE family toxin [Saccharopolyspora kobensis]|uniref:type II toxin-antitoxin system RelE/ParE family toxin n=1 Tax=Saccharopolyspora kobensis TaxID=146035 RepID=UPI003331DD3F